METLTAKEIVESITITVEREHDEWKAILRWPGKDDLVSPTRATFKEARQEAMEMKRLLLQTITEHGADVLSIHEHDPHGEN